MKNFYRLVQGHVLDVLPRLGAESVDLIVTSPPYWGLRDYGLEPTVWGGNENCKHQWGREITERVDVTGFERNRRGLNKAAEVVDGVPRYTTTDIPPIFRRSSFCCLCGAWRGQLGLEPHPQMFIDHIAEICLELKRVLKKSGSFFLNLGDTYYGSGGKGNQYSKFSSEKGEPKHFRQNSKERSSWLQPKQRLLLPHRVAIALQEQGWILRNDIVWCKSNHMPCSVKDRLTNSFEYVFHFVKSRKYFYDLDAIRIPHSEATFNRILQPNVLNQKGGIKQNILRGMPTSKGDNANRCNEMMQSVAKKYAGKFTGFGEESEKFGSPHARTQQKLKQDNVPGCNTQTYKGFNKRWKESREQRLQEHLNPQILTGGDGRIRVGLDSKNKEEKKHPKGKNPSDCWNINTRPFKGSHFATFPPKLVERIIKCSCPAEGVVLDPFMGSGRTMVAAQSLRRSCIGVELSSEYCVMTRKHCFNGFGLGVDKYSFEVFKEGVLSFVSVC